MQEELHQFELNNVWELVKRPDPRKHNIIGTKWIYRNKQDESGQVVRNKAQLVAQGYTQVEGITSMKLLLLLQDLKLFAYCLHMPIIIIFCYIKWM
jgi:hypothetical protein